MLFDWRSPYSVSPVSWRGGLLNTPTALLQRGKIPPPNECPGYDTKQSDSEAPIMLELWGMKSTPLLPSLPCLLWSRVVAPDRALSMDQLELNCVLMLNWIVWNRNVLKFNCEWIKSIPILNWIVWNRTV